MRHPRRMHYQQQAASSAACAIVEQEVQNEKETCIDIIVDSPFPERVRTRQTHLGDQCGNDRLCFHTESIYRSGRHANHPTRET